MKRWTCTLLLLAFASVAQAGFGDFSSLPSDPRLTAELERIAGEILTEFAPAKLTEGNLAMTLIDLSGGSASRASYRGELRRTRALSSSTIWSLLKISSPERANCRGARSGPPRMIVESSNDATSYVVDRSPNYQREELSGGRSAFHERRRATTAI